jgi:Glyoxalase-like domain
MASSTLRDICFDCAEPLRTAHFWANVFGYIQEPVAADSAPEDSLSIELPGSGLRIWFNRVPEPKIVKNRVHIDINMPDGEELDRLLHLGARVLREIHGDDGTLYWTIMADPEGNEFCAFPPRK